MSSDTTQKAKAITPEDEITAARNAYLEAHETWINQPTIINLNARLKAYYKLEEVRSLYAAGRKALIQKRVIDRQ